MKLGIAFLEFEAKNVKQLLTVMGNQIDGISYSELKENVIFVNGKNIVDQKMYRTKLKAGDEVLFLSPVSGG